MESNGAPWKPITLRSKLTSNLAKAATVEVDRHGCLYDRHGYSWIFMYKFAAYKRRNHLGKFVTLLTLKTPLIVFNRYFYLKPEV